MTEWTDASAAEFLRHLFTEAVEASKPEARIAPLLPPPPAGRILVLGAGKAAAGMARAVEAHYADAPRLSGLVITRHGQGEAAPGRIAVREAAHPVPDEAGIAATEELLALTQGLGPEDLVIALISGGASSLMVAPLAGLTLADKVELNRALLASGATISEMNCLRRHLSRVKGGRLAAACAPARVLALLVSDVPGDDPSVIASGPCHGDATTVADAQAVLGRLGLDLPRIAAALARPEAESVKPGDPRLARVESHIVCSPQMALEAAAEAARAAGVAAHILGDALEGDAREAGRLMAGIARQVVLRDQPSRGPACFCRAARPPSRSAARPAWAGAMSSSCWPICWPRAICRAGRSPRTRTGWMVAPRWRVRWAGRPCFRLRAATRPRRWPDTMPTASSPPPVRRW